MENGIDENIYGRENFIETFSYTNVLLNKDEIGDFTYIKDNEGFLFYSTFYKEDTDDEFEFARRVRQLKYEASKYGANTIFIIPPDKYIPGVIEFDKGLPVNDVNPKTDELLMWLYRFGVETVDFREYLPNTNITYEETFYKTDHHWTIPAAFEASKILINELNRNFEADFDLNYSSLKKTDYEIIEFKDGMVGSMGEKAGVNYSDIDDFIFMKPKDTNQYEYIYMSGNNELKNKKGDAEATLIDYDRLESSINNKYNAYMGGLNYYDSITNNSNPEGPTVLFIRDSYASPMITFMAPLFSHIDAVWCLEDLDELNIEDIVEDNIYDYIIIEVYPYNINDEAFNYYR